MTKEEALQMMRDDPGLVCRCSLPNNKGLTYTTLLYKCADDGQLLFWSHGFPWQNSTKVPEEGVWSIESKPKVLTRFDLIG